MPSSLTEILGQKRAVEELRKFMFSFSKKKKKAAFIYGPTGSGKTSAIYALAKELNYEVMEVNASDIRNKEQLEKTVGMAMKTKSFFFKGKIILLDEIDGLSGHEDRGGITTIASMILKTHFPMILTAINPFDKKLSSIRKKTVMIEFEPLEHKYIYDILKKVCSTENIKYEDSVLKALARRSGGDARAAINDLQSLTVKDRTLDKTDLETLGEREKMENIIQALVKVLKSKDASLAITAFDNVEEDIGKRFLWLEENIPKEYRKAQDLQRAFDMLSKADVYRGRIRRWQYWRFLVYVNALMTAGVATSKKERYKEFINYKPTERLLKYYIANMRYAKRKCIAEKIAEKTHGSVNGVIKDVLPYVKHMIKNGNNKLVEYFELDKDEVAWLKKKT